ncbi:MULTISPECIES: TIGR04222 domain-containing membrane protein [unclassified Streptomyces]|uniref:TIGR04222 domain-containing membrane protein n=1 Tax=unclassified Streptomyces TaxID=2593676 RepID=UPI00364DFFBE
MIWRHVSAAERRLDAYEVAYLAGGPQRVLETALFALRDRGAVTVVGPRVRAVEDADGPDEHPAEHPVERAVLASCPRGRSLAVVAKAVRGGPEVAEIERGLVSLGLLTRARHRLTPAGRSQLKAAREAATLPAYVLDGPAAHRDRRLRRIVAGTAIPAGLGRSLIRMGRAADPDYDYDYGTEDGHDPDSASGTHSSSEPGGFSCGSGGGGGGGSD